MRVLFRSHFECAARRVSDEVGVRLGKERGENDAARKHDGNAIVHVARHASFQSPPGGGSLTSIPRPLAARCGSALAMPRSEEHTSELQSLMRISYAVFCLKKKNKD